MPKLLKQIYTLNRNNWAILYTSRRRLKQFFLL